MRGKMPDTKLPKIAIYLLRIFLIFLALFFFFSSIHLLSESFKELGKDTAESILSATSNPFTGLFIGLLITVIIQSSSTSTSMVVAVVATGALTLENAVPIIMGANIGTTLTSTLVSLSFISSKKEFRRAVSAGVVHDFFNILLTFVLLPLELFYGILSSMATYAGHRFSALEVKFHDSIFSLDMNFFNLSEYLLSFINNKIVAVTVSFILLFVSVKFLSLVIYRQLIGKSREKFNTYLFKNTLKSFLSGLLLTAGVQSSSVTTSLIVPLVAKRKVTLMQSFPYIVGSNLGTTLTALLAALLKNEAAIAVALIHCFFNIIGTVFFLVIPTIKRVPIFLARTFGEVVMRHRIIGFTYIILIFFFIPFSLIFIQKDVAMNNKKVQYHDHVTITNDKLNKKVITRIKRKN